MSSDPEGLVRSSPRGLEGAVRRVFANLWSEGLERSNPLIFWKPAT